MEFCAEVARNEVNLVHTRCLVVKRSLDALPVRQRPESRSSSSSRGGWQAHQHHLHHNQGCSEFRLQRRVQLYISGRCTLDTRACRREDFFLLQKARPSPRSPPHPHSCPALSRTPMKHECGSRLLF